MISIHDIYHKNCCCFFPAIHVGLRDGTRKLGDFQLAVRWVPRSKTLSRKQTDGNDDNDVTFLLVLGL